MSPAKYPEPPIEPPPSVPEGRMVVLFLSPAAARGVAVTLGEHSTYPNIVHHLNLLAERLDPGGAVRPGYWWISHTPVPDTWLAACRQRLLPTQPLIERAAKIVERARLIEASPQEIAKAVLEEAGFDLAAIYMRIGRLAVNMAARNDFREGSEPWQVLKNAERDVRALLKPEGS